MLLLLTCLATRFAYRAHFFYFFLVGVLLFQAMWVLKTSFTTSTLQQVSSGRLGFGASRTMQIAQRLYQGIEIEGETIGLITYMRTDGTNISKDAVSSFRDYINNEYISGIGLGILVYILTLFVLILTGKSLSRLFSYTGMGSVDKIFGFFFGIFKGYVFAVCIFVIADKFDLYEKFSLSTSNSVFFSSVEWGSGLLIDNFSSKKDFENTKEKIEKI